MPEGYAFRFQGEALVARPSGALWWPASRCLVVADLHLGKAQRMARRAGALLPPWDSHDTLQRLAAEVVTLDPQVVISLGDGFDDDLAAGEIAPEARQTLQDLGAARAWHWMKGNHDPEALGAEELRLGGLTFRHIAGQGPDISGHLHPVVSLGGRRWRCFALSEDRLILPSFGSYTGGLDVETPEFRQHMARGFAIAGQAGGMFVAPFPRPRMGGAFAKARRRITP